MNRLDQVIQELTHKVKTEGVQIMGIFPHPGDDGPPTSSFNYTVGMTEKHRPELIVCGLDLRVGQQVLNEIVRRCDEDGLVLTAGTYLEGLVEGPYKCVLTEVRRNHEAFMVKNLYGDLKPHFLQVVFQDLEGHFPWDEDYTLDPRVQKGWFIKP